MDTNSRKLKAIRTLGGALAFVAASGCVHTTKPTASPAVETVNKNTSIVLRETSYIDSDLATRGLGRLEIAVRSSDRPAQSLEGAAVSLRRSDRDTPRGVLTSDSGVARFDSIATGRYWLQVRRIGYEVANAEVTVSPGCRTDVEVYVGMQAVGINPPPPMPGRVTITTCKPKSKQP